MIALIIWLALVFAMLLHQLKDPTIVGILAILAFGLLGTFILGRQVVRLFRRSDQGGL